MSARRVAFITGASSGIGYASALAFARQGYDVVGTARRMDRLSALEAEIAALPQPHGDFLGIAADVRQADDVNSAVQETLTRFGRLDVLVANAGLGQRGSVSDSDWADLETLLRTNIDGVLHSVRAAVPAMRQGGQGHIVLVSSVVSNMVSPYAAAYAASKAFVHSIGRSLRLELERDNIRVTEMLVGRTETEFNARRLGKPSRSSGGIPPVMPVEKVAAAIVKASQGRRRAVALRWIDRLILLGNALVPDVVGRLAMKQYK